jgi:hypothetical protein
MTAGLKCLAREADEFLIGFATRSFDDREVRSRLCHQVMRPNSKR